MALDLNCVCGKPLDKPGALLFSPPDPATDGCIKTHICAECYPRLLALLVELHTKGADNGVR